jgi:hypothetical protein
MGSGCHIAKTHAATGLERDVRDSEFRVTVENDLVNGEFKMRRYSKSMTAWELEARPDARPGRGYTNRATISEAPGHIWLPVHPLVSAVKCPPPGVVASE